MLRSELVVAIGKNEQYGQRCDAPPEELDEVQRRFVRPMHVLEREDERRTPLAKTLQQQRKQRMPVAAGVEQRVVVPLQCDVAQRTQRTGREEGIAGAGDHLGLESCKGQEALEKRALPDARFAGNEHDAAHATPHLRKLARQRFERRPPFEQIVHVFRSAFRRGRWSVAGRR